MHHTVVLLLGSNLNNRLKLLEQAVNSIASEIGELKETSRIYESEPWGFDASNWFYNQVVIIETMHSAQHVLEACQEIEQKLGRVRSRSAKYSSRTIDIDLLFYNADVINTEQLIIPHPRLQERNFTLLPLKDLIPDFVHPVLKRSIYDLQAQCTDKLEVRPLK